jgi:hypothetical protein
MMSLPHKIDISRLAVLDRIAGRTMGASRGANDAHNDSIRLRVEAHADLQRMIGEIRANFGWNLANDIPALRKQGGNAAVWADNHDAAQTYLADLAAKIKTAAGLRDDASERRDAAGNLAKRCREWAEANALVKQGAR